MDNVFRITDVEEFAMQLQGQDARGNPAPLSGTPAWSTSNPDVIQIQENPDGSALAVAAGKLGTARVSVVVPVGGGQVTGSLDVEVVAGDASTVAIVAGTPSEQNLQSPAPDAPADAPPDAPADQPAPDAPAPDAPADAAP